MADASAAQAALTIWMLAILVFFILFLLVFWTIRTRIKWSDIKKNVNVHIFHLGEKYSEHKVYNCRKIKYNDSSNYSIKLTTNYFLSKTKSPRDYDFDEKFVIKNPDGKNEMFGIEIAGTIIWFHPYAEITTRTTERVDPVTKEQFDTTLTEIKSYVADRNKIYELKNIKDQALIELKNDFQKFKFVPENKGNMTFLIIAGAVIVGAIIIYMILSGMKKKQGA
jgi:hypothetical protein